MASFYAIVFAQTFVKSAKNDRTAKNDQIEKVLKKKNLPLSNLKLRLTL